MSIEGQKFYPGEDATPQQLLRLAQAYREAAEPLFPDGQSRSRLSYWPCRLLAIHSVELFLNAYLRASGISPDVVRGMQHNLAKRAEQAGLKLKRRTIDHLKDITQNCEYRVVRYEPERQDKVSQLNRLQATLTQIAKKVEAAVSGD